MSVGGTKQALILLIRENTAELLSWQQRQLTELALLGSSPEDLEIFVGLIRQYPDFPVIIVADLIDENFRHDTIVHVGGSDHAALLNRKLDFSFRNTRYRRAVVTGRNPEGRKDDRILLSALTKPERIDPWARLLLQEKMAVQSVTSIAHLLNLYVPLEKLEDEEYLLLSKLDSDHFLRQTFIRNGKVMFSRQASLTNVPERRLGVEILQESVQLRQYLERIQFVPYEKTLKVQILAGLSEEVIQVEAFSNESHSFEVVDVTQQALTADIQIEGGNIEPAHYLLARILEHKAVENIYSPPSLMRYSDLRKFGKLLLATAASILILGLGLNIPALLDLSDKRSQADIFTSRTLPLRRDYETLISSLPATVIPPREMQLLVDTHEILRAQDFSPVEELNLVSRALAMSPGLQLTRIEWALAERPFLPTMDEYGTPVPAPAPLPGLPGDNALTSALLQQRSRIEVRIDGEAYSPSSYRDAQEQVLAFVDALAANPGVEVMARQMPIDIRTDTEVSTTINDSEVRSGFTLELYIDRSTAPDTALLAEAAQQ